MTCSNLEYQLSGKGFVMHVWFWSYRFTLPLAWQHETMIFFKYSEIMMSYMMSIMMLYVNIDVKE